MDSLCGSEGVRGFLAGGGSCGKCSAVSSGGVCSWVFVRGSKGLCSFVNAAGRITCAQLSPLWRFGGLGVELCLLLGWLCRSACACWNFRVANRFAYSCFRVILLHSIRAGHNSSSAEWGPEQLFHFVMQLCASDLFWKPHSGHLSVGWVQTSCR